MSDILDELELNGGIPAGLYKWLAWQNESPRRWGAYRGGCPSGTTEDTIMIAHIGTNDKGEEK